MAAKSKGGGGGAGGSKTEEESLDAFLKWARDEEAVKKWQRQINLKKILGTRPNVMSKDKRERGNGVLARLSNFFPDEVAQGAAVIASRVPEERWNTLEWTGDSSQPSLDGIAAVHRFGAVVEASDLVGVSELYHVLSGLMPPSPERYSAFHLGRLQQGDFLGSQDDAAYCVVDRSVNDPTRSGIAKCSRDVAVMLFLSKNDSKEGSVFRDLYHEMPTAADSYELEYNSLIAFHVPREYELTINQSDSTCLFLFGWFLKEGELYELEESKGAGECQQGLSKKKSVKLTTKRKLRVKARREEAYQVPPEFLKLAEEREEARKARDFERADRIREICSSAGLKFNAGGRLMKSKDFSEQQLQQALVNLRDNKNSSSSSQKPKRKESKTERILRQAREAQGEEQRKEEETKGKEEVKEDVEDEKKGKKDRNLPSAKSLQDKVADDQRAGKRKAEEEENPPARKKEPKKPKKPKKKEEEEEEEEQQQQEKGGEKEMSRKERNQKKKLDMIKRRGWLGVKQ